MKYVPPGSDNRSIYIPFGLFTVVIGVSLLAALRGQERSEPEGGSLQIMRPDRLEKAVIDSFATSKLLPDCHGDHQTLHDGVCKG